VERIASTRLTRRRLLTLALTGAGVLLGARAAGAATAGAAGVAPVLRPETRGGSASICATCGGSGHTMLACARARVTA
jgi:hypothetical protein